MNQKENRAVQLQAVADFAQSVHEGNGDGHGFDHIKRVIALAQKKFLQLSLKQMLKLF